MEGILDYADIMIQLVEKMRTKIDANSNLKQMKKEYDEWKRTMDLYANSVIPMRKKVCSSKRSVFLKCVGILENIIEINGDGFVIPGEDDIMKKNILRTQLEALGRSGLATIMNNEFAKYKEDYKFEMAKTQYRPAISTLSRALLAKINVEIATIDSLLERADALIVQLQATKIPDRTFMSRSEQAEARAEAAAQRRAAAAQKQNTEEAAQKQNTTPDTTVKNEKKRRREQQAAAIAKRLRRVKEIVERLYYRV